MVPTQKNGFEALIGGLSLRNKILLGFVIPLFVTILASAAFYLSTRHIVKTTDTLSISQQVVTKGRVLEKLIVDMETGERGFLITGKDVFLEPLIQARKIWPGALVAAKRLVSDSPEQLKRLDEIETLAKEWEIKAANPEIAKRRKVNVIDNRLSQSVTTMADVTALIESETGKKIIDAIRVKLTDFIEFENQLIIEQASMAERAQRQATFLIFASSIFLIFAVLIAAVWVFRSVVGTISQLSVATKQISEGNYNQRIDLQSHDEIGELAQSFNVMTERLVDTQNQLVASSKMASLGHMAAGIAHELNQPLGAISLNSETMALYLAKGELDKVSKLGNKNIEQIERASKIISALRQFSREEPEAVRQQCDLNELVNNIIALIESEFVLADVEVKVKLARGLPSVAVAPVQIEQVISNILLNAKDAVLDAKEHWVKVTSRVNDNNDVVLDIQDSGVGMDEQTQSRMFDPFFTTKPVGKGTGLGLSLSYSMAKSNGVVIDVESEPDGGSTFTLTFNQITEE